MADAAPAGPADGWVRTRTKRGNESEKEAQGDASERDEEEVGRREKDKENGAKSEETERPNQESKHEGKIADRSSLRRENG